MTALLQLCAKALFDTPHEGDCNTHFGLRCTCDLREERITQGLAAAIRWVATQRDNLRHRSRDAIYEALIAKFRNGAAADVKIRIRVRRSGEGPA